MVDRQVPQGGEGAGGEYAVGAAGAGGGGEGVRFSVFVDVVWEARS